MSDPTQTEEHLLSALMVNEDSLADVDHIIDPTDFHAIHTRLIYEAIQTVAEQAAMPTPVLVAQQLERTQQLDLIGGPQTILRINELWTPRSNLPKLAEAIVEQATLRAVKTVAREVDDLAESATADTAVEQARKLVDSLASRAARTNVRTLGDVIGSYREQMDKPFAAVPTGFAQLDELIGGWTPGDLNIVGAPSGHGKSSVLNVSVIAACKAGRPTVLQALELTEIEATNRLIAVLARIDLAKLTRKALTKAQRAARDEALRVIESWPLSIDAQSDPSLAAMRAKVRYMRREHGDVALWVFDHIQHSNALGGDAPSARERIDEVSKQLKGFAKSEDVPMVAAVQLNNAAANRTDKRPQQYDIRESAAPFHYASVALFAFRPAEVGLYVDDESEAELIVRKQRNGPVGVVPVDWVGPYATYVGRGSAPRRMPATAPLSGRTGAEWLEHATAGGGNGSNGNGHHHEDF